MCEKISLNISENNKIHVDQLLYLIDTLELKSAFDLIKHIEQQLDDKRHKLTIKLNNELIDKKKELKDLFSKILERDYNSKKRCWCVRTKKCIIIVDCKHRKTDLIHYLEKYNYFVNCEQLSFGLCIADDKKYYIHDGFENFIGGLSRHILNIN